jgi:glycosyltransferase involved in cell wall biosynthesis
MGMTDEQEHSGSELPVALVFAYSCEPNKGSEPGAGWGTLMAIREIAHPVVLMRPDSMSAVRRWQRTDEGPSPEFVIVPEPGWATAVRRNRLAAFGLYLLWLRRAKSTAHDIVRDRRIDLAHHVTYSAYWLPSPAVHLGVPSLWGPVGGAVTTPRSLMSLLGPRGRVTEYVDRWAVRLAELIPATRRTWRAATLRLVQNRETLRRIERVTSRPSWLFNHAVFHSVEKQTVRPSSIPRDYLIWMSQLESRKGPELVVRAAAQADPSVRLLMAGDGPERERMHRLASELGVGERIEFIGSVEHTRALQLVQWAKAAVFTGLREEGGLALAEALFLGVPTIVLDHGGPGLIGRAGLEGDRVRFISVDSEDRTVRDLAAALSTAMNADETQRSPIIDRSANIERLRSAYTEVLEQRGSATALEGVTPIGTDSGRPEDEPPAISVVMAAFNAERFIGEAIASVLTQTFDDLELIVVDDASSDGTGDVIAHFAERDGRVRMLRNERNLGTGVSLNRGIAAARANLIGRLDADDICFPERFERQVEAMRQDPDLVVSGTYLQYINADGDILGVSEAGPSSDRQFARMRERGYPTMVMGGTALMRRDAFEKAGGFDPEFKSAEDLDLFSRMAHFGKVVAIPEPLLLYRIHRGSLVLATFFEGRRNHRLVQHRERSRANGGTWLKRDEYIAHERNLPLRERVSFRRVDTSQYLYRIAALNAGEGKSLAAVGLIVAAGVLAPRWVSRRIWAQRVSSRARGLRSSLSRTSDPVG